MPPKSKIPLGHTPWGILFLHYILLIQFSLISILPFFNRLPMARLNSFLLICVSRLITSGFALSVKGSTPSKLSMICSIFTASFSICRYAFSRTLRSSLPSGFTPVTRACTVSPIRSSPTTSLTGDWRRIFCYHIKSRQEKSEKEKKFWQHSILIRAADWQLP